MESLNLSRELITNLILAKNSDVSLIKPANSRSQIWERFFLVAYKNQKLNFVQCVGCKSLVSYKSITGMGMTKLINF
jgi:hypothetical protein